MNTVTKIACRSVGTLGMGIALFDACQLSKHYSKIGGKASKARQLNSAYYNGRTIDNVSYVSNNIRKKTFNVRAANPLPEMVGEINGGIKGFLYGIGNFLPAIAFSSLALLGKSWGAKVGAIGVGLGVCLKIAREGFGLGKKNPMK